MDQTPEDPQSWNLYAYVRNNPLVFTDPTGCKCAKDSAGNTVDDNEGEPCAEIANEKPEDVKPSVTVEAASGDESWFESWLADASAHSRQGREDFEGKRWGLIEITKGEMPLGPGEFAQGARLLGEWHHIASVGSIKTGFTAAYKRIFQKAGLSMQAEENLMFLIGHRGRHANAYKQYVLDRLTQAVEGLQGSEYTRAVIETLKAIRAELLRNPLMIRKGGIN